MPLLNLTNIHKTFEKRTNENPVLRGLDLESSRETLFP